MMTTVEPLKPFLVDGKTGRQIYRVMQVTGGARRPEIELLFQSLPIYLELRSDASSSEKVNEPLEVYIDTNFISLFPPEGRIVVCVVLDDSPTSSLRVGRIADHTHPGRGQIRSNLHFRTADIGIGSWTEAMLKEIHLYINSYPVDKEKERKFQLPDVDVKMLLELIAGGEQPLTRTQLLVWQSFIRYAIARMRACYERKDNLQRYFANDWKAIDTASDPEAMIKALEGLRHSIQWL